MIRNSLKIKVSFYLVVALTAAVCLFTFMVVHNSSLPTSKKSSRTLVISTTSIA